MAKVSGFQACMKRELKGKHHKNRAAQQAAFKRTAKACKGR